MKHIKIFIFAIACFSVAQLFGASYFTKGTFAGDSRYNVKKTFEGDTLLCWAAAGSNIIQLWQDRNAAYLTDNIPNGKTSMQDVYSLDIFYIMANTFTDQVGMSGNAFTWWINGILTFENGSIFLPSPMGTGNYYSEFDLTYSDYLNQGLFYTKKDDFLAILDDAIKNDSMIALTITHEESVSSHIVSLWGYEYDEILSELSGIWISDSDNPAPTNFLLNIRWDESDSRWYLDDEYYEGYYVGFIDLFFAPSLHQIPEPAHSAILLVIAAGAYLFIMRRKK